MRLLPHHLKESLMPDSISILTHIILSHCHRGAQHFHIGRFAGKHIQRNPIFFLTCEIHFPGSSIENDVVQLNKKLNKTRKENTKIN